MYGRIATTSAAAFAACLLAAVAAPAATGPATFNGSTNQGRGVQLRTDADAVPSLVRIAWKAHCRRAGYSYRTSTRFAAPFESADTESLSDSGRYTERTATTRASIYTTLTAAHQAGDATTPETWTGSLVTKVVVYRKGKVIDVCRLRKVTFKAKRSTT